VFPFSSWNSGRAPRSSHDWEWRRHEQTRRARHSSSPSRTTATSPTAACSSSLGLRRPSRSRRSMRRSGPRYEVLAGDHPDEGQQRDAPGDVAERRVRGRHGVAGWEYGNLSLTTSPPATAPEMMPDDLPAGRACCGAGAGGKARREPVQVRLRGARRDVHNSLTAIERGQLLRQDAPTRAEAQPVGARVEEE